MVHMLAELVALALTLRHCLPDNMVYNRLAEEGEETVRQEEKHVKRCLGSVLTILGFMLLAATAAANVPPVASFEIQPSPDGSQTTIVLDATSSHDPDGSIIVYGWNFGDGSSGSGVTKAHTYPAIGKYEVKLNVIDNSGASHLVSQTVDLANPIAPQAPPGDGTVPSPVVPTISVPYDIPVGNRAGERAPAFALPNQNGEIVQLIDFLGQVVLVEFWSSSCSACQASLPHLEALRAEFADRGLVVVTITINRNVEGEWQYLNQNGFTQFVALRESDPVGRPTKEEYGITVIPHAFLIDQRGVIFYTGHVNYVRSDMIESVL